MNEKLMGLVLAYALGLENEKTEALKQVLKSYDIHQIDNFIKSKLSDFSSEIIRDFLDDQFSKQVKEPLFMHQDTNEIEELSFGIECEKNSISNVIKVVDKQAQLELDEAMLESLIDGIDDNYLGPLELIEKETNIVVDQTKIEEIYQEIIDEDVSELEDLIDSYLDNIAQEIKEAKDEFDEGTIKQIKEVYQNLNNEFIVEYYNLKEELALEYKIGTKILLLHRNSFKNVLNLNVFAEEVTKLGYDINVDETKMIVDAIKVLEVIDGCILSEIFECANLSAQYQGYYEGYLIKEA